MKRKAMDTEDGCLPLKKKKSPWHKHLKLFAQSEEGKAAMAISAGEFNRSASSNYAALPEASKESLKAFSAEPFKSKKEVIHQGGKIFKRLKSLIDELEYLGYQAFAIGFYHEKMELVGTKATIPIFTPDFVEFLHAKIITITYPQSLAQPLPKEAENSQGLPAAAPPPPKRSSVLPSATPPPPRSSVLPSAAPPPPKRSSVLPSATPPPPKRSSVLPSATPPPPKRSSVLPSAAHPPPRSSVLPSAAPPPPKRSSVLPSATPPPPRSSVLPSAAHPPPRSSVLPSSRSSVLPSATPPPPPPPRQSQGAPDEPIVINSTSPLKDDNNEWIKSPYLFKSDLEALVGNQCLTCRLIDGSMELLKKVCPEVGGWQSVTGNFSGVRENYFVQIMLVRGNHWITATNINCPPKTVYIYDSLYAVVDKATQLKICSVWRPQWKKVRFMLVNTQRQTNFTDCGLFAIAVATELAFRRDPRLCLWDTSSMRKHLKEALEASKIEPFPLKQVRRQPISNMFKGKIYEADINCLCRLPNQVSRQMVQCDLCGLWCHYDCVDINKKKNMSNVEWKCPICLHKD